LKLALALTVCALLALPLMAADESKPQANFAAEYGKHWKTARELTLAVADAMPADGYGLKPDPGEMSFGEQIAHIAQANYGYCSAFTKAKSPFTKPANFDKETVMKLAGESINIMSMGGLASSNCVRSINTRLNGNLRCTSDSTTFASRSK